MRRQRLADANQSSVRSSRYTGLPEVGVWGTERETMHALVERSQGVYIVADDLQVVNGHLKIPSLIGSGSGRRSDRYPAKVVAVDLRLELARRR
jgi:hypothetical protein